MTLATNLTDINLAVAAAEGVATEQQSVALAFARAVVARGCSTVDVLTSAGVLYLHYATPRVAVTYRAEAGGSEAVRVVTRWDNGHDAAFSIPPRAYGLVAAMLAAGMGEG